MARSMLALAFLLILAGLAMTGCSSVPPEVVGTCEGQAQILEAQSQNTVDLINGYEADILAAYDTLSKERLDRFIASGEYNTPEKVKQLVLYFNENSNRYRAESEARKARAFAVIASNVKSGKTLNDAMRKYLDQKDDTRKNLEAIIQALKPPAPGAGQAPPVPQGTASKPAA